MNGLRVNASPLDLRLFGKEALSFRQNLTWALLGNGVSMFFSWVLLVLLTKLSAASVVGEFALAQAVGLPIYLFFGLKLSLVQVTDSKNQYSVDDYYAVKVLTSIAIVVGAAIAGFAAYDATTGMAIAALGLSYGIMSFRELFLAVMQKREMMNLIAISHMLNGLAGVALFCIAFILTANLAVALLALTAGRVLTLYLYDLPVSRRVLASASSGDAQPRHFSLHARWDVPRIWEIARISLPLGIVALLTTVLTSAPRLILDQWAGVSQVGYFAALSALLVVGDAFMIAVSQSIVPRLAKSYQEDYPQFRHLVRRLVSIGLATGAAGIAVGALFGRQILSLMFTPAYSAYAGVLVLLLVGGAALILFSCMNVILSAARMFSVQLPVYLFAAASCIVSSFLLIPQHGITGAAIAYTCGNTAGLLAALAVVLWSVMRQKPSIS